MLHAMRLVRAATIIAVASAGGASAGSDGSGGALTTAQLLRACSMAPGEAAHAAAMRFCHGFADGVLARRQDGRRCALSQDWRQTMAGYAAWVHANPIHLDDNPASSLVEFLDLHGHCRG